MRFTPLHSGFGTRVHDFDLQNGGTPDEIRQLRQAFDEYHMLLFRDGGRVSPERHLEIVSWFGPPGPSGDDGKFVTFLDNREPSGRSVLPFHSDLTYTEVPVKCISLHPVDLPENATSTTFVSGVDAWKRLPEALKEKVADLKARHYFSRSMTIENMPALSQEHPVRLIHPRTGAPILFVTQYHADRITGCEEQESTALLDELFSHLYAAEQQYEHVWHLHDFLIWDNLALQHARTQQADQGRGNRKLQRAMLSEATYSELIERARQRQIA